MHLPMFTPRKLQSVPGIPPERRKPYKLRQRWETRESAKKVNRKNNISKKNNPLKKWAINELIETLDEIHRKL